MKKIVLLLFLCGTLYAQNHITIPLDDPIYIMIENARIRNLYTPIKTAKPYTKNLIVKILTQITTCEHATEWEKNQAQERLDEFVDAKNREWYYSLSYKYDNLKELEEYENAENEATIKTDEVDIEDEIKVKNKTKKKKDPFIAVEVGPTWRSDFSTNLSEPNFSSENWLGFLIKGDISEYFSYNFNIYGGFMNLNLDAYSPYTYSQKWGGAQFIKGYSKTGYIQKEISLGLEYLPELGLSLWNDKVGFNFSRIRRDWGIGDGNLMLSKTAAPIMGFETYLNPLEWMNLSFMVGGLEFFNEEGLQRSAKHFQNILTTTTIEFFAKDWVYLALNMSVVWPERFELGYLHPGIIQSFYQNSIGDFDNVQLGFTVGFNVPKYLNLYLNVFIDEMDVSQENLLHKDRTMFAYQWGAKLAIPQAPFTNLIIQYTKVEPYMYTHPPITTPWYSEPMYIDYTSHGEPLGYKLDPNSDELLIKLETMPFWFFNASLKYRMIRHGLVDGSKYGDRLNYGDNINNVVPGDLYYKDFMKDGVYEWYHEVGLNGEVDLRFVKYKLPIKLGLGYSFVYKYHTQYNNETKKFDRVESEDYKNKFDNIFSIYFKIF